LLSASDFLAVCYGRLCRASVSTASKEKEVGLPQEIGIHGRAAMSMERLI